MKKRRKLFAWGYIIFIVFVVVAGLIINENNNKKTVDVEVVTQETGNTQETETYVKETEFVITGAADYFRDNVKTMDQYSVTHSAMIPWDMTKDRDFTLKIEDYVENQIIPNMEDYPDQSCSGMYNEDGSIYEVTFYWGDDRTNKHKEIHMTWAPEKDHKLIFIGGFFDSYGSVIKQNTTETFRDGVEIWGRGVEGTVKALTFYKEGLGWIHIYGSANVSCEEVVNVMDWFWEHGFDTEAFDLDKGDIPTIFDDGKERFVGYYPVDTRDYVCKSEHCSGRNDVPDYYNMDFRGSEDESGSFFWTVSSQCDSMWIENDLGKLEDLTIDMLEKGYEGNNRYNIGFWKGDYFIHYYGSGLTVDEIWYLIEQLK